MREKVSINSLPSIVFNVRSQHVSFFKISVKVKKRGQTFAEVMGQTVIFGPGTIVRSF